MGRKRKQKKPKNPQIEKRQEVGSDEDRQPRKEQRKIQISEEQQNILIKSHLVARANTAQTRVGNFEGFLKQWIKEFVPVIRSGNYKGVPKDVKEFLEEREKDSREPQIIQLSKQFHVVPKTVSDHTETRLQKRPKKNW